MSPTLFLAVVLSAILDYCIAAIALFGPRPIGVDDGAAGCTRVGFGRIVTAAVLAGMALLTKTILLGILGLDLFGFIRLVYLELFFVVPGLGLTLLLSHHSALRSGRGWPATPLAHGIAALALLMPSVAFYASCVEPYRLQLETAELELPSERAGQQQLRIGVIADLQARRIGAHEERAIDRLLALEPHLILVPGDLYQARRDPSDEVFAAYRALFDRMRPPGGVYVVEGNTDRPVFLRRLADEMPHVHFLDDEITRLTVGDRRVSLAGTSLGWTEQHARRAARDLEQLPGRGDIRLLLSHKPDAVFNLEPASRVDLVVAGHTHGGQVVLPILGPPITLTSVPRKIARGGLGELDGRAVYVSRGIGMERGQAPPLRFLCPPEISLLTLR